MKRRSDLKGSKNSLDLEDKKGKFLRWPYFRFFLIFLMIVSSFLFSFFFLKFFLSFSGRLAYLDEDFEKSYTHYKKLVSLDKNEESFFNNWVLEYRLWDYKNSKTSFENALSFSWSLQKDIFFNLGNTYFYLGQASKDNNKKISSREQSLLYFEKSLSLKEEKETRENYLYVKDLLEKERQQRDTQSKESEDKEKEENQEKEENSWGTDEKEEENESWKKDSKKESEDEETTNKDNQENEWESGEKSSQAKQDNTSQSSQRDEKYSLEQEDTLDTMSDSEKEYLEGYKQFLERQQEKNQENFNDFSWGEGIERIFDRFFNDPFFESDFIEREKDW